MTPLRFESEELDEASLEYLGFVRESEGAGMPGVFFDEHEAGIKTGSLAGWGALIGSGLLLLALILMWSLNLHDPFRTSLLVTALAFLGGWLLIAWIRCIIARNRANYIGLFKYVDPLYLWYGTGGGVWVTPLRGLQEARCKHDYAGGGGYKGSVVHIVLEEGVIDLEVKAEHLAEGLEKYLEELVRDRAGLPVERGYAAVKRARLDEDVEYAGDPVEGIPEPHKARTSIVWLFKYPVVLAAFAFTWFCIYGMSKSWHDSAVFDAVKDRNVADLRIYIADPRNTANRPEVLKRLKAYHEQAASRLEQLPGEPDLKTGLARLIRSLDASPAPVITVAFARPKEAGLDTMDGVFGKAETTTLCLGRIHDIGTEWPKWFKTFMGATGKPIPPGYPSDMNDIGPQIVAFGAVTDQFSMIEIDVKLKRPDRKGDNLYQAIVTVRMQENESPEAAARAVKVSWKKYITANNDAQVEEQFRTVCEQIPTQLRTYFQQPIPPQEKP